MFHIIVTDKNGDVSIYDTHIEGHRKGKREKYRVSLKPGFHTFQILGKHSFGNASSEPSSCLVKDTPPLETPSLVGLAAGLGIGVAIIVVAAIMIVILVRRRISKSKDNSSTDQGRINLTACDDDGDGLKDNILYESAGDNFTPQGQAAGVEYAVVNKKGKPALPMRENDTKETALYSIVDKKGNVAGKVVTGTKGKNNRKPKGKIEKKELHTNRKNEDVYENVTKQHVPSKQEKNLNKDGLCYADLVFNPSPTGRKFIIHGLEDRTIYAEVDTTQKIDPLPDSDDGDSNESADLKKGNGKG